MYWACFSEYVQSIVSFGDQPLEFFVEGTRSRTGKALHPKVGLFGVSLRPYFDCRAPDITLVPVAITYVSSDSRSAIALLNVTCDSTFRYEERMETHSYVKEMLGTPKTRESFGALIQARSVMQHNCGRMHIKVCFFFPIFKRTIDQFKMFLIRSGLVFRLAPNWRAEFHAVDTQRRLEPPLSATKRKMRC